jgi:uncharacterized membrane protein YeaQ/YmgE (transglycosylase-associated protein family)
MEAALETAMLFLVVITWILTGLLVGWITTKVINLRGDDPKFGLAAAGAGGVIAGAAHAIFSTGGMTAWTVWTPLFAAAGAVVAVALFHVIRSRSISHDRGSTRSSY